MGLYHLTYSNHLGWVIPVPRIIESVAHLNLDEIPQRQKKNVTNCFQRNLNYT